jgi:hypothetical protein
MESVHRLDFKDGSASYYVGELAYDDTPSTEKGRDDYQVHGAAAWRSDHSG